MNLTAKTELLFDTPEISWEILLISQPETESENMSHVMCWPIYFVILFFVHLRLIVYHPTCPIVRHLLSDNL